MIFIVAQAKPSSLRSLDQILPASKCGVVAATEAVGVDRLGVGQQDVFLLKGIAGVGGSVKRCETEV